MPINALRALLVAALVATASCGDDDARETAARDGASAAPDAIATPDATATPEAIPTADPPATASSIPDELVGTWVSTDPGAAELVYVFAADGSYKHAGVMLQQRDTGMFSLQRSARGTLSVRGGTLVLEPESGMQEISDPDVPSASGKEPIDTTPERYEWAVDEAGLLQLTDGAGSTIEYAPE